MQTGIFSLHVSQYSQEQLSSNSLQCSQATQMQSLGFSPQLSQ
ncbi:hypothetical protein VCRA213O314_140021 [Vibrio crassostreae]|nr:hypothetical protein VCRA213O314_140021 [Vibrio crassostreae]